MVLAYYGTSLANRLRNPLAHKIRFCDAEELSRVKITHDEYADFLNALKELSFINEVMLISTCNRFEVIADIKDEQMDSETLLELAQKIAYENRSGIMLSHLLGEDARRQIIRTYCGLNSGLIGEDEICIQIDTAFQQGLHMGYLAKTGEALLREAKTLRNYFNSEIYPERVSYCDVAIKKSLAQLKTQISDLNKVVIFGSGNTAIKSAESLVEQGLAAAKITILHRVSCSSTQLDTLRENPKLKDIQMQRCKDGYHIPKARTMIDGADLVIFGIDSRSSVLELPYSCPIDSVAKGQELKVIDFNSKSSVLLNSGYQKSNYIDNLAIDKFVRAHATEQIKDREFRSSLSRGELYIQNALVSDRFYSKAFVA